MARLPLRATVALDTKSLIELPTASTVSPSRDVEM
jgi:hypothetical protein